MEGSGHKRRGASYPDRGSTSKQLLATEVERDENTDEPRRDAFPGQTRERPCGWCIALTKEHRDDQVRKCPENSGCQDSETHYDCESFNEHLLTMTNLVGRNESPIVFVCGVTGMAKAICAAVDAAIKPACCFGGDGVTAPGRGLARTSS